MTDDHEMQFISKSAITWQQNFPKTKWICAN